MELYFFLKILTNKLYEDETTELFVSRVVDKLKDDDSINDVIDRTIREL